MKNVGDDFHILVSMSSETSRGLDQIIIDNPQTPKSGSSTMPFYKRKMESAFQPIFYWSNMGDPVHSDRFQITKGPVQRQRGQQLRFYSYSIFQSRMFQLVCTI